MFSAAAPSRRRALTFLLLVALLAAGDGRAEPQDWLPPPTAPEAWLVTYGPGEIYWQRFGHNAIWLREPGGLDHTFNFGFFDFEQESFLLRFVQGRMLYFAAAVPAAREIALYREEGREVRVQRLELPPDAYRRLREHLLWHVQPEHRDYLYDYYLDNCSTRLRDALDLALAGGLSERFAPAAAAQNFREHTRRSTQTDRDYYFGLVAALGLPVDRAISRWDEMFLPAVLAEAVAEVRLGAGSAAKPLVSVDRVLVPGTVAPPPARPGTTWPVFAVLGAGLALAGLALARFGPAAVSHGLARAWLTVGGVLGLGLAAVWGFTDHEMAYPNCNLLLLNPLWLLGLWSGFRRAVAVALCLGVVSAIAVAGWPGGQYMADTVALLAPLNVVVAGWAWRRSTRLEGRRATAT